MSRMNWDTFRMKIPKIGTVHEVVICILYGLGISNRMPISTDPVNDLRFGYKVVHSRVRAAGISSSGAPKVAK